MRPDTDGNDGDDTASVPVLVIGGYLGAGKTTLVNRILREADRTITVLVNDFGAVNIDASLIADVHGDTIELTNGCVCCSVGDDLTEAMLAIAGRVQKPDLVIIETSGVADPRAAAAYAHVPGFSAAGTVVVIDATDFARQQSDRFVGRTVRRQVSAANLLLVSKTDLDTGDSAPDLCAALAPQVQVIEATDFRLSLLPVGGTPDDPAPPGHPGTHTARTVRPEFGNPQEALLWLRSLGPSVERAKGIVSTPSGNFLIELAGSRATVTPTETAASDGVVLVESPTETGPAPAE